MMAQQYAKKLWEREVGKGRRKQEKRGRIKEKEERFIKGLGEGVIGSEGVIDGKNGGLYGFCIIS